jgi:hypothetical protein
MQYTIPLQTRPNLKNFSNHLALGASRGVLIETDITIYPELLKRCAYLSLGSFKGIKTPGWGNNILVLSKKASILITADIRFSDFNLNLKHAEITSP